MPERIRSDQPVDQPSRSFGAAPATVVVDPASAVLSGGPATAEGRRTVHAAERTHRGQQCGEPADAVGDV